MTVCMTVSTIWRFSHHSSNKTRNKSNSSCSELFQGQTQGNVLLTRIQENEPTFDVTAGATTKQKELELGRQESSYLSISLTNQAHLISYSSCLAPHRVLLLAQSLVSVVLPYAPALPLPALALPPPAAI